MIIEDEKGNQLLALRRSDEDALAAAEPLTHAFVVASNGDGKHLLIFNRYKTHWEQAGGSMEPTDRDGPRMPASRAGGRIWDREFAEP